MKGRPNESAEIAKVVENLLLIKELIYWGAFYPAELKTYIAQLPLPQQALLDQFSQQLGQIITGTATLTADQIDQKLRANESIYRDLVKMPRQIAQEVRTFAEAKRISNESMSNALTALDSFAEEMTSNISDRFLSFAYHEPRSEKQLQAIHAEFDRAWAKVVMDGAEYINDEIAGLTSDEKAQIGDRIALMDIWYAHLSQSVDSAERAARHNFAYQQWLSAIVELNQYGQIFQVYKDVTHAMQKFLQAHPGVLTFLLKNLDDSILAIGMQFQADLAAEDKASTNRFKANLYALKMQSAETSLIFALPYAMQQNDTALLHIGLALLNGEGCNRDINLAIIFLKAAIVFSKGYNQDFAMLHFQHALILQAQMKMLTSSANERHTHIDISIQLLGQDLTHLAKYMCGIALKRPFKRIKALLLVCFEHYMQSPSQENFQRYQESFILAYRYTINFINRYAKLIDLFKRAGFPAESKMQSIHYLTYSKHLDTLNQMIVKMYRKGDEPLRTYLKKMQASIKVFNLDQTPSPDTSPLHKRRKMT